jgi:hypothetical protein
MNLSLRPRYGRLPGSTAGGHPDNNQNNAISVFLS